MYYIRSISPKGHIYTLSLSEDGKIYWEEEGQKLAEPFPTLRLALFVANACRDFDEEFSTTFKIEIYKLEVVHTL